MKLDRRSLLRLGGFTALLAWLPRSIAKALGYPRALQGPMIGAPGPNHVTVWVRTSGAFEVVLELATDREFRHPVPGASATAIASAAHNFCVTLRAEGLEPDTVYWYRLKYQGEDDRQEPGDEDITEPPAGEGQNPGQHQRCERHPDSEEGVQPIQHARAEMHG